MCNGKLMECPANKQGTEGLLAAVLDLPFDCQKPLRSYSRRKLHGEGKVCKIHRFFVPGYRKSHLKIQEVPIG
jgi:hypothetical protein